jgi:metal-responsive CopG/Arc/MetJ family transcriptional regulator
MQSGASRITVSLPPDLYTQVAEIARDSKVSISWVVRYAVERLVAERPTAGRHQLSLPLEREERTRRRT